MVNILIISVNVNIYLNTYSQSIDLVFNKIILFNFLVFLFNEFEIQISKKGI